VVKRLSGVRQQFDNIVLSVAKVRCRSETHQKTLSVRLV
jgi:hypothetical protein